MPYKHSVAYTGLGGKEIGLLVARASLLGRIVLLVLVATLPAVIVLLTIQRSLLAEREARARIFVQRQAELVHGDLRQAVQQARSVAVAIAAFHSVRTFDPDCGAQLSQLRQALPAYQLLAVLRADGSVLCSTAPTLAVPAIIRQAQALPQAIDASPPQFYVGRFARPDGLPAMLPAFLSFPVGGRRGVVVLGLGLDALERNLRDIYRLPEARILVADRHGTVLAAFPPARSLVGQDLPPAAGDLLRADAAGVTMRSEPHLGPVMLGFVPAAVPPGLFICLAAPVVPLSSAIDRAAEHGYLLIGIGALISLGCALVIAQRYVRAPTAALLTAAARWSAGDYSARARLRDGPRSEFGQLASAFNRMVEQLGAHEADLRSLNEALEARVAERTHELLETNNRLQVAISQRERSEATLRQAQKLQVVGQLAGGLAHDFNNVLTVVGGTLDVLRHRLPTDEPRLPGLVRTAQSAVERGARLTAQLLAFSRRQQLLPKPTDLNAVVQSMAAMLGTMQGPQVTLETRLDPALWAAMVDPNQLEAAILNLVLNARDAMPDGGRMRIETVNRVVRSDAADGAPPGEYVGLIVADTGTGMAPEVLARVFEPFFTTKPLSRGSGLGLSQVHGLIQQSGGDIQIESKPGVGTTVTLLLPRAHARPDQPLPEPPRRPDGAVHGGTILLVDDDASVREVTAEILAEAGYAVATAPDGESALQTVEERADEIRLVVADYAMPGMNGLQLLSRLRRRRPELPALIVTGYAEFGRNNELEDFDLDNVIRKPFRPSDLLRRVDRMMV